MLGLVGHEVEELRGTGQVFLQRNGLGVVVDEVEVAVCLEPRHAWQIVAAIGIEAFGIAAFGTLVTQLAGLRIVNPAMVRTGKHARVARRLTAYRRTAVCTGVEVGLRRTRTIATEDDVVSTDRARDEIARTRDLRTVTHVQPAAPENNRALALENLEIGVRASIDAKLSPLPVRLYVTGGQAIATGMRRHRCCLVR